MTGGEGRWKAVEGGAALRQPTVDRKSTRLNSSHGYISYAVFCLKKKKTKHCHTRDGRRAPLSAPQIVCARRPVAHVYLNHASAPYELHLRLLAILRSLSRLSYAR